MNYCPYCEQFYSLVGQLFHSYCPNYHRLNQIAKNAQSTNSFSASHHSEGRGTGQQLLHSQESQNLAPLAHYQVPVIEGNPTRQSQFENHQAGNGRNHLPESQQQYCNFNNAQTIATNQMDYNGCSAGAMQQQAIVNEWTDQGYNWNFNQRTMDQRVAMSAFGPPSTFKSFVQNRIPPPRQEPVAGPSSACYSNPGVNGKNNSTSFSAQNVSTPPCRNNHEGFCVMCEEKVSHLHQHWTNWHEKKDCYETITLPDFKSMPLLKFEFTRSSELKQCPILKCQKVFFTHRYYNHGCPVQIDSSDESIASLVAPGLTSVQGKGEYCLMCKFFFDDVELHREQLHNSNQKYVIRNVFGQKTLLPGVTRDDKELFICMRCLKIVYISQSRRVYDIRYCLTCFQHM